MSWHADLDNAWRYMGCKSVQGAQERSALVVMYAAGIAGYDAAGSIVWADEARRDWARIPVQGQGQGPFMSPWWLT